MTIAIIIEGGIVQVVTDNRRMIGKQIMVIDYDDLEENKEVVTENGKVHSLATVTYQEITGSRYEVGALKSLK